jgi:hypothetical protein
MGEAKPDLKTIRDLGCGDDPVSRDPGQHYGQKSSTRMMMEQSVPG